MRQAERVLSLRPPASATRSWRRRRPHRASAGPCRPLSRGPATRRPRRQHVHSSFARLGVLTELSALPHVESSYNPLARSHVGASGIWQFTRGTGRRFMRIDHVLDERNDPYAATVAAGELLAYNYSIVGNWPMATLPPTTTAWRVRRAMRRFGDTNYVRILREYDGRTFGFASRNFYVAFLAAMRIDQDPEKYFPGVVPDAPLDYERVALPAYRAADAGRRGPGPQ
ncbi:MAG: transglycosylase SLT domain-containing protein [Woeseiaceae bacterium]|nr:transglycosylase SLT domain-containing protein [Woeseiaceae bacterium]